MIAAVKIANAGSIFALISQLLCAMAVMQIQHEKRCLWLLTLAYAFLFASIACVVYESLYFGF